MSRPKKGRLVCRVPKSRYFGPMDSDAQKGIVAMTVDEYEAIRLIDLEGLSQEGCAQRMGVARTTAQSIYNSARAKLAACLVNGLGLSIGGGDYILCDGDTDRCGCGCCHKKRYRLGDEQK